MNRTPAPLLVRALRVPTRLAVAGVAVIALAPALTAGQGDGLELPSLDDVPGLGALPGLGGETPAVVASGAPGTAQRAATLMVQHDCWAGEAPDDVERPGHAVVTLKKGERLVTRYGGERLTGRALEHVFGEPDPAIFVVHGFCR